MVATYDGIKAWVHAEYGFNVKTCWIAHMKEICGLPLKTAHNRHDLACRTNACPLDKRGPILAAFMNLGCINDENKTAMRNSRWITAVHEAGHAVVHWKLGGKVNYLELKRSDSLYCGGANVEIFDLQTKEGRYKDTIVALAGEAALTVFGVPSQARNPLVAEDDFRRIRKVAGEDCRDCDGFIDESDLHLLQNAAYKDAVTILNENKKRVMDLAEILLSYQDGEQIIFPW